jgi:glycosyl transferase family 2
MSRPFFSIMIPTYNRCDLVPLAIESILRQTFEDFEVVVSDNCSDDATEAAVRRFSDPRVRYLRTPRHMVIADNWEFARTQASGVLTLMLSDDDALVASALGSFADGHRTSGADFLFCGSAQYRDQGFPGAEDRNRLDVRRFSGAPREMSVDEFLTPLFSCRITIDQHPSAYVFTTELAASIAERCGRFFQTNGVEHCAWPLAAVSARRILYIDRPLAICGRTGKSWGSNLVLANPGHQRINQFIADVDHTRKFAFLNNFTMTNLIAEGVMTAKQLLPREFARFQFDEPAYLRRSLADLRQREAVGVDVSAEIADVFTHATRYPGLVESLRAAEPPRPWYLRLRRRIGEVGPGPVWRRYLARRHRQREAAKVRAGDVKNGFQIFGDDFGFADILGCAAFLERIATRHAVAAPEAGMASTSVNGSSAVERPVAR